MTAILLGLVAIYPVVGVVLGVLGALVVIGQAYVAITPTQTDDAWFVSLESIPILGILIVAVRNFAPIQRREPPKLG